MEILSSYELTKDYINKVQMHADNNKDAFGFLPFSSYEDMALKNQLWLILCEKKENVVGYLMFGGTYPKLKVFQLFADSGYRGQGIAKRLIEELINYGEKYNYSSLSARVAADLSSNGFWEKMGFLLSRQEVGGTTTDRLINIRTYQFPTKDLLSDLGGEREKDIKFVEKPVLANPTYALDLNPLFDITKKRSGELESKVLLNLGFGSLFDICITPEFKSELIRTSNDVLDDPILEIARSLPCLPESDRNKLRRISAELRKIIFPDRSLSGKKSINDSSDLNHIAHCVVNNVSGYITRERSILKCSQTIYNNYGLKILSPQELLEPEDNAVPRKFHTSIGSDSIAIKRYSIENEESTKCFLLEEGVDESSIRALLSRSATSKSIKTLVASISNDIIGFSSWNVPDQLNNTVELYIYYNRNIEGALHTIDHMLESAIRDVKPQSMARINLHFSPDEEIIMDTAIKRGFIERGEQNQLSKIVYNGYIDPGNWEKFKKEFENLSGWELPYKLPKLSELRNTGVPVKDRRRIYPKCLKLFEFETLISPGFLLPKGRECLILPIKEEYAVGLVGDLRGQYELMPSSQLTLYLEKAYFRSKSRYKYFSRGAIVLFYVSGSNSIQEIVGIARITYSDLIKLDNVKLKLKRQGTLSDLELLGIADEEGLLHVFTFDNFNEVPNRLSFRKAKEIDVISKANLTTVEKVSYKNFNKFIREVYR